MRHGHSLFKEDICPLLQVIQTHDACSRMLLLPCYDEKSLKILALRVVAHFKDRSKNAEVAVPS